jgi:5'(3')-deoxyribonucleotidase
MRIGIDIDDVLFPWFDRAHEACTYAGITNGVTPSQWECWKDYGTSMEAWLGVMEDATLDGSLYTGAPYPGAIEALRELKAAGHTLHMVTARGFFIHGHLIRKHTVEWLETWHVPHDTLTFAKDKTLVHTDVFVDDSWKNVQALVAAGIPTWMVDAPHNQGAVYDLRVPSVVEFAAAILAMETV